ncbi:secreted protein [Pseudoalteromonas tunicata]|jgi:hypothetical protein|uniref:Secreted protein n=1 Tax=Pseudoalteromonas tunicata D2 TaxID=87626 RepID=A4CCK1_9GAMM|nr:secreted protein [Pseudoalteromonas tunicata]ATC93795.1 hypothetical protein PTUN_a1112 [Pseudoalteromonas tunicata]AXT29615.1 hypothetical protein D1819_01425 [Pseudoalteromonas tunicata]EAR27294.1 Secreted protein [Pseudoalteromonas tunicata D2]
MNIRKTKPLANLFFGLSTIFYLHTGVAQEQASLFLFGQELEVCSSENTQFCAKSKITKGFDESAKLGPIYAITDEAISRLSDINWTEQPELKAQTIALLKAIKPEINDKQLSERDFVRILRRSSFSYGDEIFKGRDVWSGLFEFEKNNLFDLLEQKQSNRSAKRLKTEVDLASTENETAMLAYQAFYQQAKQVAGSKRKPRVAFVTGGNRDPYQKVDYYYELFNQLGFEAIWLPLDAAMQTVMSVKDYDNNACDSLSQLQVQKLASFRRDILYPDLFNQQLTLCKKKEGLINELKRADAIYIADGSPLLTSHAFYTPTGEPSVELLKIKEMLANNQLIVGVEGQTVNMLASQNVILSGEGVQTFVEPTTAIFNASEACNLGVDCISLEAERTLTYLNQGILDLFPYGILDNQITSLARETRLLKTAYATKTRFAFGLEKQTAVSIAIEHSEKGDSLNLEVIGRGGIWVFDTKNGNLQTGSMASDEFVSHYFTHQDKFMFRNNAVSHDIASWKVATRLNSANPTVTSAQPFARNNFYKFNQMLCNTGASSAQANGQLQEINYTLQLVKDASSTARQGALLLDGRSETVCSFSGVSNKILVN